MRILKISCALAALVGSTAWICETFAQSPKPPVKVQFIDGKKEQVADPVLPMDPTQRITIGGANNPSFFFGLSVDQKRLCCGPDSSIWASFKIDDTIHDPFNQPNIVFAQPVGGAMMMKKDAKGKPAAIERKQKFGDIEITQILQPVPGKPVGLATGKQRKLDTCRITYVAHNQGSKSHKVALRTSIDMMINNNDGALYASPSTQPGKILNGVDLKGKDFPEYLHCVESPAYDSPGFVATMTFKPGGKAQGPDRIVLTHLGLVGGGNGAWDVAAQPAGDSACAIFWSAKEIRPGEKHEFAWAYGGGYAVPPESEGSVRLTFGGSFEPNKVFTVQATIDDPAPNQTLTLELPKGMQRVEGKEIQPVPVPNGEQASSVVLWKARVLELGEHELTVRSSLGTTLRKKVVIQSN